jgi:hypothetical protein
MPQPAHQPSERGPQALYTRQSKNPSDEGKRRARGGTRTAFQPLQTLGTRENVRNPKQFEGCTGDSEAKGVDIVHTSLVQFRTYIPVGQVHGTVHIFGALSRVLAEQGITTRDGLFVGDDTFSPYYGEPGTSLACRSARPRAVRSTPNSPTAAAPSNPNSITLPHAGQEAARSDRRRTPYGHHLLPTDRRLEARGLNNNYFGSKHLLLPLTLDKELTGLAEIRTAPVPPVAAAGSAPYDSMLVPPN